MSISEAIAIEKRFKIIEDQLNHLAREIDELSNKLAKLLPRPGVARPPTKEALN